jgi:hypothetical protein
MMRLREDLDRVRVELALAADVPPPLNHGSGARRAN